MVESAVQSKVENIIIEKKLISKETENQAATSMAAQSKHEVKYENMNVKELQEICRKNGMNDIKGFWKKRKNELIDMLNGTSTASNINKSKRKMTFIEVCAGAGGLSTGFMNAGFEPLLLNDTDKYCVETLQLNHPNTEVFQGSMVNIDLEKCKNMNVDVLMGGVPCQSFSQAGKRKGISDDRGKLILHFIKMIDVIEPKIFVIENVKGLLTHNKGKTLTYVISEIDKLGKYNVDFRVLNANNYDVPQNRERLIIVGTHKTLEKKFKFPDEHKYKPVLKDVLSNCPSSPGVVYSKEKHDIMKKIPEGGCWVDLPVETQKSYMGKSYYSGGGKRGILKRLDMNKPSLTLLTTPSQKQTERCHPLETRPLQILEYSRIQTFPDDYKFAGSVNQVYKQIGNAVPVNLGKAIAREVANTLK